MAVLIPYKKIVETSNSSISKTNFKIFSGMIIIANIFPFISKSKDVEMNAKLILPGFVVSFMKAQSQGDWPVSLYMAI